jgi:hypothetical protein
MKSKKELKPGTFVRFDEGKFNGHVCSAGHGYVQRYKEGDSDIAVETTDGRTYAYVPLALVHIPSEKEEAILKLRDILHPGDRIYTILRHVSRSGMMRVIDVQVMVPCEEKYAPTKGVNAQPRWIGHLVATAIGMPWDDRKQGIRMGGCGTDMGWEITYHLGWALYGKEWPCTGEGCPSNVHSNGDRDHTPGRLHGDGGYALKHAWL